MGESLDEIVEKARVVADATGRDEEDVLADLLDDGIVNDSHRPTEVPKDLITQLKEAAELITTVQEVNAQVSENKVLNGGENRTEVVVETTLDCDIVDRALASAQRKADDLKKLIVTLIPVFLLLTGGSLEAFGIIDIVRSEEDDGDPWPPDCNPEWIYEDTSRAVNDADLLVAFKFTDNEDCDITINGHFIITLVSNGELYDEDTIDVGYFSNEVVITQEFNDLEDGTYEVQVELHELECKDGTCSHGANWNMDPITIQIEVIIKGCMDQGANNYNPEATEDDGSCEFDPEECIAFFTNVGYQWENDTYGSVDLTVSFDADWSCEGEVSIGIDYFLKDKDGTEIQNESMFYETIGEQQDLKYFYSFSLSKPIDQSICLVLFYQDGDDWREDDEHNENLNL